jgi:hypothetical protein
MTSANPNAAGESTAANLAFTRFLFIVPQIEDEAFLARLRAAGSATARGFSNDFDADGSRESQALEAIQFLVADRERHPDSPIAAAPYVAQVTGKYRPRLVEAEGELQRRLGDAASVIAIEGAERAPRYTSAELHEYAYRPAPPRRTGRVSTRALILPVTKTPEWWSQPPLERHAYFYPHVDAATGCQVLGHARAAEEGIARLYRRLYHNPDGYGRPGEYDFITYFECAESDLEIFARVHRALQDTFLNPEWRYVQEGPLWIGRRVLRW